MAKVIFRKPTTLLDQIKAGKICQELTILWPSNKLEKLKDENPDAFMIVGAVVLEKQLYVAELLGFDSFDDMTAYQDAGFELFDKLKDLGKD